MLEVLQMERILSQNSKLLYYLLKIVIEVAKITGKN